MSSWRSFLFEPPGQCGDNRIVHVRLAQISQGLDHQSAQASGGGHVFGRGPLEKDFPIADSDIAIHAIGQEYRLGGHLVAEA